MTEHYTQRSRMSKIDQVEAMIIKAGGWNNIVKEGNTRNFLWIVSRHLNCTYQKAKEYTDIVVQSSLSEARMKWNNAQSAEKPKK